MTHARTQFSQAKGFTLVETLVAIAIIMIAIVGPYFSIQQAIVISYAARDQLIASQLAQEGQEYIHFQRDTNYLSSASWMGNMNACFLPDGCTVDPAWNFIASCSSVGCPPLKLSPASLYTQLGSNPVTRFTRTVKMQTMNSNEVQVTVTVDWITNHRSYSVKTVDELYNWL